MNNSPPHLKTFVLLVILLCHAGSLLAESKKELPGLEWERRLGDDKFRYNAQAMAFSSKEGDLWIGGTSSLAGSSGESGRFWLWKVNKEGEKIQEILIKSPYEGRKLSGSYPYIKSLTSLENDDVLLPIEFIPGQPSIVKIDKNGDLLFTKALAKRGSDTVFSKIVPTEGRTFLLVGRKSKDAFVLKINASGNILWSKTIERGKRDSIIYDAIPAEDGGALLIGNSGTWGKFGLMDSDVWLVKLNERGKIESGKTFPGRHGSVTKAPDGRYIIVYDKGEATAQDIWVQALTSELEKTWEAQILSVKPGFAGFKIASVPTGGFIVAGSKRGSLWVARINNEGKEIWNFWEESIAMSDAIRSWNLDCDELISLNNELFILSSVYSENDKRQINNKVGLIKFIQK